MDIFPAGEIPPPITFPCQHWEKFVYKWDSFGIDTVMSVHDDAYIRYHDDLIIIKSHRSSLTIHGEMY